MGSCPVERQYNERQASRRARSTRQMAVHSRLAWFAAVDCESQRHQTCVLAADGTLLGEWESEHGGPGAVAAGRLPFVIRISHRRAPVALKERPPSGRPSRAIHTAGCGRHPDGRSAADDPRSGLTAAGNRARRTRSRALQTVGSPSSGGREVVLHVAATNLAAVSPHRPGLNHYTRWPGLRPPNRLARSWSINRSPYGVSIHQFPWLSAPCEPSAISPNARSCNIHVSMSSSLQLNALSSGKIPGLITVDVLIAIKPL